MTDKNIGFIGLGVMGQSMAGHLLAAGFNVRVYNRTRQKADALVEKGAIWCDGVADLAAASDIIITIVGYPADVQEVFMGPSGILENAPAGALAIDMTTSDPALAKELWQHGRQKDIGVLDAPVSGGDIGAKNAALSIMVGGGGRRFPACPADFQGHGRQYCAPGQGRQRPAHQDGQPDCHCLGHDCRV